MAVKSPLSFKLKYTPAILTVLVDLAASNNYYNSRNAKKEMRLTKAQKALTIMNALWRDSSLNLSAICQKPEQSIRIGKL
jgi:hypothetical protein